MKNLYYYQNKVINFENAVEGESITVGAGTTLFVGSEKACKRKAKELALDHGDYDLSMPVIPQCSPRQIRLWLLSMGVTEVMVIGMINQIPDAGVKAATLIEYEYASVFERNHPFVDQVGLALGLTLDQIDDGFTIASRM